MYFMTTGLTDIHFVQCFFNIFYQVYNIIFLYLASTYSKCLGLVRHPGYSIYPFLFSFL